MNAERWRQIDIVFQQAVELDPDGRAAFLDTACNDDANLRAAVVSLLVSDSQQHNFIDDEVLGLASPMLAYDPPRLIPGDKLAQYEIAGLIGRGGMGEVYLAKDETLNRRAALKLLPDEYTSDAGRLRRLQQEALAASVLNHPNILTIYELREFNGFQFIATEFIDGLTLREEMSRGKLPLLRVLDIAMQVAGAISAAHQAGIIHRDIKPENIMVRPDGYVKVLDFGLAKLKQQIDAELTGESHEDPSHSSGLVMGTVKYMSPEQAQGLPVDARSDIFSMGTVFFEMAGGHAPFQGKNAIETVKAVVTDDPPLSMLEDAPEPFVRIIRKALAKDPNARYQDAEEFLSDLKALKGQVQLAGLVSAESRRAYRFQKIRAGMLRWWATLLATVQSHKLAAAFVAVALTIAICALVYSIWPRKAPSQGTWSVKTPLSRPRTGAAVATLNGKLFVATGFNQSGATNELDEYDPANGKWISRAPILTARSAAGAAGIDGKLYVFGGCTHNSDCRIGTTNIVEVYDPAANSWSAKSPMPTARSSMASAVIGGKLYVTGGRGPCPPCKGYDRLEIYDPTTDTWDTTKAPLPAPFPVPGGAALDEKFYIVGGVLTASEEVAETQRLAVYDPVTDTWSLKAVLGVPRNSSGLAAVHGRLYAIGGASAIGGSNAVEAYDPSTDRWNPSAPLPAARTSPRPVVIDGIIYITGGGGSRGEPSTALDAYTAPCPGSECSTAPPGLVGWWPGDGNANDLAEFSFGSLVGTVKFEPGKVDQAFNLDDSSFVTVGNPPALNLAGTQMTMAGWIKPRANSNAIYFGKTEYGANDYLLLFSRGLQARLKANGDELPIFAFSDFPSNTKLYVPPIGQWTHVAMTYDGQQIRIYINGKLMGEARMTGNIDGDNVPFNIGGRADDQGTGKFNGLIDEVQVFDRALPAKEIEAIFEAGSAGICKPRKQCP